MATVDQAVAVQGMCPVPRSTATLKARMVVQARCRHRCSLDQGLRQCLHLCHLSHPIPFLANLGLFMTLDPRTKKWLSCGLDRIECLLDLQDSLQLQPHRLQRQQRKLRLHLSHVLMLSDAVIPAWMVLGALNSQKIYHEAPGWLPLLPVLRLGASAPAYFLTPYPTYFSCQIRLYACTIPFISRIFMCNVLAPARSPCSIPKPSSILREQSG